MPLLLDDLKADPGEALTAVLARIPIDAWQSGILAWKNAFVQPASHLDIWLYIGFGSLAAVIIWFLLRLISQKNKEDIIKDALTMTVIGFVLTLAGGLPLWISKTTLALSFPENRVRFISASRSSIRGRAACRKFPKPKPVTGRFEARSIAVWRMVIRPQSPPPKNDFCIRFTKPGANPMHNTTATTTAEPVAIQRSFRFLI